MQCNYNRVICCYCIIDLGGFFGTGTVARFCGLVAGTMVASASEGGAGSAVSTGSSEGTYAGDRGTTGTSGSPPGVAIRGIWCIADRIMSLVNYASYVHSNFSPTFG